MLETTPPGTRNRHVSRLIRGALVAAVFATVLALFFGFGLHQYLSVQGLAENRAWLLQQISLLGPAAGAVFVAFYASAVGLSLPGAAVMTITGGFLFGPLPGTVYTVVGATLGAIALFILVRVGFGNALVSRAGGKVERLRSGFSENAFSYLLFLRLVPIFPFWLVNLAAALLSVPLRTFALTTAVGIIPGSAIFASFGGGVGAILDDGGPIDLANVLTPSVVLPIAALSASAGARAISNIEPQQGNFPALEPEVARRPRWRPQGSLKPT